ncbi:glycosyltransferase family 2 protein [Salipiger sp. 1_MG-2023]|uniref:glycosyltransferase family 2 protein n=1 Tax=Salipiger sp. 1_MG-2023 TaxID=3062665 RepID=UPI0026E3025F|nr:glycosyltransferase family 2 protein [Salipiger sp. 1_MG-2023]MDO6586852.1 glycosyltransferase family 2 protein [Salipiger sp. 1_MG-2023]
MQKFRADGNGAFHYTVNFETDDFANISFLEAPGGDILFHLSLRENKQLAVTNARRGGKWQGEAATEVSLAKHGDRVIIRFSDAGVQVDLNGTAIITDGERYPGTELISVMQFTGGLIEESFWIEGEGNARRQTSGSLQFIAPLQLRGWGADPVLLVQRPEIRVEGTGHPLRSERQARPELAKRHNVRRPMIGVAAALPGRVWQGVEPGAPLRIRIWNNGAPCGNELDLTREGVLEHVTTILGNDKAPLEQTLLAIEHVRFAGLVEALSDEARGQLFEKAARHGLTDWLGGAQPAPAPAVALAEDPEKLPLRRAQAEFAAAVAGDAAPDLMAHLSKVLDRYGLTPPQRRELYLSVSDAFCAADAFGALYAHAASEDLHRFQPGDGPWYNSVILPFLCLEGRLGELRRLLDRLATPRGGWLATPAIAFVVRELLRRPHRPDRDRAAEEVLQGFMQLVLARAGHYWDRTPCAALTDAAARLVRARARLPDAMGPEIETFALRAYGLSPMFWQVLGTPDSPLLEAAAAAFSRLREAAIAGKNPAPEDLAFFERFDTPDLPRWKIELCGPAGQASPVTGSALAAQLSAEGARGEAAAIRVQAFPGGKLSAEDTAALVPLTRRAIRARYGDMAKGAQLDLQRQISRDTVQLLSDLGAGRDVDPQLGALLDGMTALAAARSGFLGIGMMLMLLNGLQRGGHEALATRVLARLNAVRGELPEEQRSDLYTRPAIHAALMALSPAARGNPSGFAAAALALFPNYRPGVEMPPPARIADWSWVSPLFDTVVVVMSCKPNLDTRIPAMREAWLNTLGTMGIPYLIAVGDGDGAHRGDTIHLTAPDDYESLPQKTLAAVRWVHDHTEFSHMLKIDDDCFLDVESFFYNQSYRKHHYYGRKLRRELGQTDRSWHCTKARSERGRFELDRSPEPSEYADGGSGYCLSRHAMKTLLYAAGTPEGRRLINVSFMEDKIVGDLLALQGLTVQDEDYLVSIRRRSQSGGVPVAKWLNSFHPGPSSGVVQVHLDTHEQMADAKARLAAPGLFPKKIWPSFAPVRLGYQSGALELISDEAQLAKANAAPVAVVACLRNEMVMLPHFLAHYRKLGVEGFLLIDNCSDDGSLEYLLEQPDVAVFSADTDYRNSHYGVAWQLAILSQLRVGRWSVVADIDEMLVFPKWQRGGIAKVLNRPEYAEADAIWTGMLDMYPKGPLEAASFASGDLFAEAGYVDREPFLSGTLSRGPYSDASTVTSALRHRLLAGSRPDLFVAQKYAVLKYRPWMRLSDGLHYAAGIRPAPQKMLLAHFKYSAHFRQKALDEVARGQHFNNAEEYRRYLALVSEGREIIFDPAISVPWLDSPAVRAILK